ncbi:MAG: SDR family NAD(P)-dependent oxidoreductase [Lachnospiraceae bacterium]|nr:SDR family NAD(P)-dependent oxidoreductase [Lachnospiraceae bacterium]
MNTSSFERIILITGASRGIGRAITKACAPFFDKMLLVCQKSEAELLSLINELEKDYPVTCIPFIGDIGNPDFVSAVFKNVTQIDAVINNAGISHIGLLSDMSLEEWHSVINTNLNSVFYTSRLAIPYMVKRHKGKIINISSIWGNSGASMEVAYSASKGGVNSFTKALAKELAPSSIQVNAIACGVIDTDMNRCFTKEERDMIIEGIPADRMGTAEEVAKTVLFLLDAPAYLTGQIITLDGGYL